MSVRLPTYAAVLLVLVFASVSACNRDSVPLTSPNTAASLTASLKAEPDTVRPEFLPDSCPAHPSFGVRLTVIVGGPDLIVRGVRFAFSDRFGRLTLPHVFATSSPSSLPSGPVPVPPGVSTIPNSSPIPIPGSSPINGVLLSDRSLLSLPFFLRFGCDVIPDGTILITGDLTDKHGRPQTPEMRMIVRQ